MTTKKMEFLDWASSPSVPDGLTKDEVKTFMVQRELQEAAYYAQFPHTRQMASFCRRVALSDSPIPDKAN